MGQQAVLMLLENPRSDIQSPPLSWPWRVGVVVDSPLLASGISEALEELNARCLFRVPAGSPPFDIAGVVEREKPDLLFVELACVPETGAEWIERIRRGGDSPLIAAIHPSADPAEMISALRAGAGEFLSLPLRPAIFDAMERVAAMLESRQAVTVEKGRMAGFLSAKGGCGATSLACHLAAALRPAAAPGKVLVVDLDCQSPATRGLFRTTAPGHLTDAFNSVRRLNSAGWADFVTAVAPGLDLLTGLDESPVAPPEPWRVESLFRFVARHYRWILVDLGRHLNPANWAFLQNIDELFVITAPDVLALYQTRSILQTLSSRGFEKSRMRLILNSSQGSPRDFWVESIEQMFEMSVFASIPNDVATFNNLPRERFEFPANSPFGRAIAKLANRIAKPIGPDSVKRAA